MNAYRPVEPGDFQRARLALGLSVKQAAKLLETDVTTIRRVERRKDASTHRPPPVRMAALYEAFLAGFRPKDWPEKTTGEEIGELIARLQPGRDTEIDDLLGA